MTDTTEQPLPRKHDVFGVLVSAVGYDEALCRVMDRARARRPMAVAHVTVHSLVTARRDPHFLHQLNGLDMATADGQPVRWALNLLHGTRLRERVYGPELMLRLCRQAAGEGVSIYLYGSTEPVIEKLERALDKRFPGLRVAGAEAPPFRPLTDEEDDAVVRRMNESGAGLVFVGLGAPRQEAFAAEHRDRVNAAQLCVGAAFDFHAGTKKMAPRWMQRWGLEWLYRVSQEPRRLWKRYLFTNAVFLVLLASAVVRRMFGWRAVP